jgi:hypothetical protein
MDKLEDVGFEELAREFQSFLSSIASVGDKGLERFREEYEKLYLALRKSHDNELRLIKKVRELNNEIVGNGTAYCKTVSRDLSRFFMCWPSLQQTRLRRL